jgi:hypothetical protein
MCDLQHAGSTNFLAFESDLLRLPMGIQPASDLMPIRQTESRHRDQSVPARRSSRIFGIPERATDDSFGR